MKRFNFLTPQKKNLIKLMCEHLEDIEHGRKKKLNNEAYAKDSYYAQKTAILNFKEFLNCKEISTKQFNEKLLRDFVDFMTKKGLAKNSIRNNIKQLLIITRRLILDGKTKKFDVPTIKLNRDSTIRVYLTEDELTKLKEVDLSLVEKLESVRDLFLMQCYTSLRFSDAIRIAKNTKPYLFEENGRSFFRIITKKTRQPLVVPLKKEVLEILHRRNYKKINLSMQYYNKALKTLCEFAGIDDDVVYYIEKGGVRTETVMKKYELVSSHTGRRTFITNAVLAGVTFSQIQAISGHTTTQSLLNYLHASNLEIAKKSFDNEFFQ